MSSELADHGHSHEYEIRAQPLLQIMDELRELLRANPSSSPQSIVKLRFPNPQSPAPYFEGELYLFNGEPARFRSLNAMINLTRSLGASFALSSLSEGWCEAIIRISQQDLGSWHHRSAPSGNHEKYGAETIYGRLNKLEDPTQLRDLERVYKRLSQYCPVKILSLGCNQGDELWPLWRQVDDLQGSEATFIGVDHSITAIDKARAKYPDITFRVDDIRELSLEEYSKNDLLIILNVLQSPSLDGHALFKSWIKNLLMEQASVVVGLPNCRYHGYEAKYGAVSRHGGNMNDMSQMLSEVQFYTRYLRQQGFTVWVTGEHTLYIVGRR